MIYRSMQIRCLFLLVFLSPLVANISPSAEPEQSLSLFGFISSNQAHYDGNDLRLTGDVILHHDLGILKAQQATLHKKGPALKFSTLDLEGQVSLFCEEKGTLFSENAFFDFHNLLGTISSRNYPVIYQGIDYDLFCKTMELTFTKNLNRYTLKQLIANEDVHIESHTGLTIDCDQGCYQENQLIARGRSPCILRRENDTVFAQTVCYDLENALLTLEDPKGSFASFFFPDHPEKNCTFSSKTLIWDEHLDLLTLKENISIQDQTFGTLLGKDLLCLKQRRLFGKRTLESIEAQGETTLITHENETFTNYGTMRLDRDELLVTCDNPPDQRLKYEKDDLLLYADHARIEYAFQSLDMNPHAIFLDGNVNILSHDLSRPLRKGIADHIVHNPQKKETRLIADEGNHVLFWDEEKNLSLSAPEILIEHGEEDLVKGLGIVRFIFTEEEGRKIDELFHHKRAS